MSKRLAISALALAAALAGGWWAWIGRARPWTSTAAASAIVDAPQAPPDAMPVPSVDIQPIALSANPLPPPAAMSKPAITPAAAPSGSAPASERLLPEDVSETSAGAFLTDRWKAIAHHNQGEARYLGESADLHAMCGEAFTRWPALAKNADLQRIRLHAGERCCAPEALGDDLWALATAGPRVADPGVVALREIERAYRDKLNGFVFAYAQVVEQQAPDSAKLPRVRLVVAMTRSRLSAFDEARAAFRAAAGGADARVTLDAWKGLLGLAMAWQWNDDGREASDAILAHPDASDEDRALALYGRATARIGLGDRLGALEDCRAASEQYPQTVHGRQAVTLAKETRAESLRALAP